MALPKWEDLSKDEQDVYRGKVSNLINIIDTVMDDAEGFTILTGSNGGGKSMIRNQFGLKYQKKKKIQIKENVKLFLWNSELHRIQSGELFQMQCMIMKQHQHH